ncbi:MAG: hypothetical protein IPM22_06055 [Betaproteobacteria bacterium]|nr:hypothetical protein [Betaproteobacteria bacterium]MCC7215455.1 hypothetical protein [Burkholderiales bacterium]
MRNHLDPNTEGASATRSARAVVATLCVLGLASLMWLHSGPSGGPADALAEAPPPASATTGSLHAPTSDPSLPSLEATMSRNDVEPADAPAAPTF